MPDFGVKQQIRALLGGSPRCRMHALPHVAKLMLGERRAMRWVFRLTFPSPGEDQVKTAARTALKPMSTTLEPERRLLDKIAKAQPFL
jgi:hypothetical protein